MLKILAIFAALCGFLFTEFALAQASSAAGVSWSRGVSATGQTVYFGPSTAYKTSAQMGEMLFTNAVSPSKNSIGTWSGQLAFGTQKAAVVAKGAITAAGIFSTAVAIVGGPAGALLTAAIVLPGLIDYFNTPKTRVGPQSTWGTGQPMEIGTEVACTSNCTEYAVNVASVSSTYFASRTLACANYKSVRLAALAGMTATYSVDPESGTCGLDFKRADGSPAGGESAGYLTRVKTGGGSFTWAPASIEDIRAEMEKKPSTMADINAVLNGGGSLPISYAPGSGASPVTGPASVSEPPVKTVANDGTNTTTTTTTTKTDLTYGEGPHPTTGVTVPTVTGTTNTTTNISVVNNSTGAVTTSNSTTNNNAPPATEAAKDPCSLNPERVGCKEIDTPDGEIPKTSKTITYTAESPFGGGSCPANLVTNVATLGKSVTVWDWQKTCDMALPLRALVLALASFAAFLIVMPGETRT